VYFTCDDCRSVFASRIKKGPKKGKIILASTKIAFDVKDKEAGYAQIICPRCGGKTDTDLRFWEKEGLSFS